MIKTFSEHPIRFALERCVLHLSLHIPMIKGRVRMDTPLMNMAIVHIQYLMRFRGLSMMGLITTHPQLITPRTYSILPQDQGITMR